MPGRFPLPLNANQLYRCGFPANLLKKAKAGQKPCLLKVIE